MSFLSVLFTSLLSQSNVVLTTMALWKMMKSGSEGPLGMFFLHTVVAILHCMCFYLIFFFEVESIQKTYLNLLDCTES